MDASLMAAPTSVVVHALRGAGATSEETGGRQWRITLPTADGGRVPGLICLRDGWLEVRARPDGAAAQFSPVRGWSLLERHPQLGLARFALARNRQVGICTEIPLSEGTVPHRWLELALTDLRRAACGLLGNSPPAEETVPSPEVPRADGLARLCQEAGWTAHARANGATVDLETGHGFFQASVEAVREGVRLSAEIARWDAPSAASRAATAVLLLVASGVLRLARPCLCAEGGAPSARWEVLLPQAPDASAVDCALEALSVACRFTAREAFAMGDEKIAGTYLRMRGWAA